MQFGKLAVYACAVAMLQASPAASPAGFVYVMTNDPGGNSVIQYLRASDGSLTKFSEAPTQGLGGTGNGVGALDPLGSQDSLVLTGDGSLVLAVNAGSNEISSLRAGSSGLQFASKVPTGGTFPNSIAVSGNLVYVLNAHTPNIAAFRLVSGELHPVDSGVFPIPGGLAAKPHDIRFSPDGSSLVVSVEGTNQLHVLQLDSAGRIAGITSTTAAGNGPFGMRFARGAVLVNAEAGSASASSYRLTPEDTLAVVSAAVPDGQAATCWITVTADGKFGFVSNTASGTLSSYQISGSGTLSLASAVTASLDSGGAPIDSALSADSMFFYVLDSALGRVVAFRVSGVSLHFLNVIPGLPRTLQGIAAQ